MPPFEIGFNSITCELETLNRPCRVIFFKVPQEVAELYASAPEKARQSLAEFVVSISGGKFKLLELWEQGWEMRISCFPDIEEKVE